MNCRHKGHLAQLARPVLRGPFAGVSAVEQGRSGGMDVSNQFSRIVQFWRGLREPVQLPTGGGELMPEVDLSNNAALLELMEDGEPMWKRR